MSTAAKILYIVRGLPGSGKSSLVATLTPDNVAADDFPGLYVDGDIDRDLLPEAHAWCLARVGEMMLLGRMAIAVHNTFTRFSYIQAYTDLALQNGYAVQIIHTEGVWLSGGDATESIHNVPTDVLERMSVNWQCVTLMVPPGRCLQEIFADEIDVS